MSYQIEEGLRFLWNLKEKESKVDELVGHLGISPLLAKILTSRGFSKEMARDFLNPSPDKLTPPKELPDMEKAVDRVIKAITKAETIMIHGDYDVDGITSVSLLVRNLLRLGVKRVIPYIPSRFIEGYGLSNKAVEKARDEGATLIVTADCGITAHKEAEFAKEMGIDLIITDHHEPPNELPNAYAIVDPKRKENPNELAGVGVAFKLLQGVYEKLGRDMKPLLWDLDLVAVGTIADQVPLIHENRVLASLGLKTLEHTLKVGLKALKRVSGIEGKINTYDILFRIGPRLNAAGRLSHAKNALNLLLTKDPDEALRLAKKLDMENKERQRIEDEILDEALKMAEAQRDNYVIVLSKEGWHEGVIGIVASKVVEEFYRPTFLIAMDGEFGKGSGRSIPPFNIFEALKATDTFLETYGGHKMAAGLRIHRSQIEVFKEAMNEYGKRVLKEEDLKPHIKVDVKVSLGEINDNFIEEMEMLGPFGVGNPMPIFYAKNVSVVGSTREVGNGHLRFLLKDETGYATAIFFGGGQHIDKLESGKTRIDVVFKIKEDTFAKRMAYDLNILDFKVKG